MEVREKILSILQAFVEHIATLPYGNLFYPQKSSPCSGFKDIHRFLNHLPVPAGTETRSMPHADARDGNFLPSMTEDEQKRFKPSELLLYKHALEYR
jgi:hypothetical protein